MKHRITYLILLLAALLILRPQPALAQTEITCASDVIVQADVWLPKIATKFFNDPPAFPAIAEATNAKAAVDNSYATINNVDLIEPGWKLCIPAQPGLVLAAESRIATVVPITLLHMNDVYEITPVSGGAEGGLTRVATLRKQLLADNPNTFTLLAGDLFSPSALGTAKVDGERLAGQQTVAVMNVLGLDFMTFGNHEFDVKKVDTCKRPTFPATAATVAG